MIGKKILVVEDDGVLRDVLIDKLKSKGYDTYGAEDGEIAIEKMEEIAPDLVLLDILMPKKNGMEVLEIMHANNKMKDIPVIIISNSGQPVEIERAKKLGAKDFLVKAIFNPSEVLSKVNNLLNSGKTNNYTINNIYNSTNSSISLSNIEIPKNNKKVIKNKNSSKGNVLVVEDDKFLRELLSRKLSSEGFSIESAINSKNTFEIIEKWRPEIILLDLILPEEDGFSILEKLKKDPKVSDIPVIILSNLGQQEDIDKAISLGAIDFMVKANFTLDEITNKVSKVINVN